MIDLTLSYFYQLNSFLNSYQLITILIAPLFTTVETIILTRSLLITALKYSFAVFALSFNITNYSLVSQLT